MYTCWMLTDSARIKVKNMFPPVHPDFIGHHITYMFGKDAEVPAEAKINIIGHCVTDKVECFVVEVDGSVVRKDGGIYHLTWSLDKSKGAKPVDSNKAIENNGFKHLEHSIEIATKPELVRF